jgi:hypothetical protein
MKLPATIKGSSKASPQMMERQREINQEVNARYKQLVGGQVGGKAAEDGKGCALFTLLCSQNIS